MFLDALPLSYTGIMVSGTGTGTCSKCLYALVRFDDNTGNPFRSGVLKVMSLARFLCATPVTGFACFTSLALTVWVGASVKLPNCKIPATGVDPVTSRL